MTAVSRRLAAGLAFAVPLTLAPVGALAARAAEPASAVAAPTSVAATVSGLKPGDWRWRDYIAQKPVWRTSTCSKATLVTATELLGKSSGLKVECAVVRMPLDWTDLSKGSIALGMTRLTKVAKTPKPATGTAGSQQTGSKQTGSNQTGSNQTGSAETDSTQATTKRRLLLLNPGGPGGPAGPMVPLLATTKPKLPATHQIVGVDPRGVGLSQALPCPPMGYSLPDFDAFNAKHQATVQRELRTFVRACVRAQGKYLPHITTANTVHDMDFARRLMGYPTSDWYGLSGGTWMGAWLAQLHPKTVGRVVLDANTQFTADWRTSFADFPMGFQRRWDAQFLPWAARANKTYQLGSTTKAVRATYAKIRAASAKGKVKGMAPAMLDTLSMMMVYADETFGPWAQMLSSLNAQLAKTGTATSPIPAEALAELTNADPATATVRTAILCNDTPYPRTPASYIKESQVNAKRAPLTAYPFLTIMGGCAYWPYQPKPAPTIDGHGGVPTMLMVQTELDPATPLEGARRAHAANKATRLLFVDNQGSHGGYLSTNTCVDTKVGDFLTKGTLPDQDITCPGTPLPGEKKVYEVTAG